MDFNSVNWSDCVKTKITGLTKKSWLILALIIVVVVQWCINSSLDSQCASLEYTQRALVHVYSELKETSGDLEFQAFMCDECTATFE